MANLGGKLTLTEVSKIECQLKVNKPEEADTAPLRNQRHPIGITYGRESRTPHTARGAVALLDRGVSVPLKDIRLPFRKPPAPAQVVMRRPPAGRAYSLGPGVPLVRVTAEQMNKFTKEEEMAFLATHGKQVSRMVAHTLCRGCISRRLLVGATAWLVRNWIDTEYVSTAMRSFVFLLGTDPFYEYYQISREDKPDEAETEPKKQGELKTVFEPSHSPFGFVWQVADATGWKVSIYWKV